MGVLNKTEMRPLANRRLVQPILRLRSTALPICWSYLILRCNARKGHALATLARTEGDNNYSSYWEKNFTC